MSNTTENRVKIISKLTAVSSRPVGSVKTHPFTDFDRAMGRHSVHVVFYYKAKIYRDFDLDPIRVSLSDALSWYPPVTGRVVVNRDGQREVRCNDAGVRVFRARVGSTLDEWLRSADGIEEKDLTVWDDMPEDPTNWSPFRIQVNEFEGGGIGIGISCPHMHADLTCATLLYKSWTDTHRNLTLAHPPIFSLPLNSDLELETDSTFLQQYHNNLASKPSSDHHRKMASATFKFSHSVLKTCLATAAAAEISGDATPFDFLAALFWTRVARAKNKDVRRFPVSICTDARSGAAAAELGRYGNALRFSLLSLDDFDGEDLGRVTRRVRDHVAGVPSGVGFGAYGSPELTFVSMEHMAGSSLPVMYSTEFGDGAAELVHVSYNIGNVGGEGLIIVTPSPGGELARAVTVTLPVTELGELCEDQAILRLDPIMILSGGKSTC